MQEDQNPTFTVQVSLQKSGTESLEIKTAETTDGVPYYKFDLGGKEVQIRENEDGKWEVLWGELDKKDAQVIGDQITKKKP